MKVQRLLTLMIVFFVLSTGVAAAGSLWGDFDGFSKARVYVNDVEQSFSDSDVPAFITHGKTVLPLRTLADSLQALVKWDNSNKTVSLYKPNVHMFLVYGISKDLETLKQPFGKVNRGDTLNFFVYSQVDNLKTNIRSIKISIKTPSGDDAAAPVVKSIDGYTESFWYPAPFTDVTFSEYGKYTVQFAMKQEDSSEYTVVSEKQIVSE
jgi:hypothetical protein